LIAGNQIPNNPGRIGSDGKLYTSAGIPREREQPERPKGKIEVEGDEDRAERGRRGMGVAAPPREEAAPKARAKGPLLEEMHREGRPVGRAAVPEGPIEVSAPTIDELLEVMAHEIQKFINWTQADGFLESYRSAGANARGLFQTAVFNLAARASQLRRV
jgi:hypothetical protein